MQRLAGAILVFALALAGSSVAAARQATPGSGSVAGSLVYHQITTLEGGTGGVGLPVLSSDGSTAVFADAPGTQDPAIPNRIYIVNADGAGLAEVDAYQTHCYCGSWVDISADGTTVVSTESMQLRLVRNGGEARTVLDLTSNEMSSIRLTGDGDRVFVLVARDTAVTASAVVLQRGIYAVEADGSDVRQIAGPDQIAGLLGVTPDQVQMLRLQTNALDVSSDGSHVVFGAYVGPEQAVFAVAGDGSDLHQLRGDLAFVRRVAISGDGATVAYDVSPPDTHSDNNEVEVVDFGGGEPRLLATRTFSGFDDPMQLSDDGGRLLISPNSYLIDTATGTTRQLAVVTPGIDGNTALLVDGMPRATMDATATRFLYVFRGARCADCPNFHEQLATLDLDPTDPGDVPTISEPSIDPSEIPLNAAAATTASATVDASGTLLGVGLVALYDGLYDLNVGRGGVLHDDGQNGDLAANDGVFTNNAIVHIGAVTREDDTGPRTIRIQAEMAMGDGRRHAIAVEAGTLTVVAES